LVRRAHGASRDAKLGCQVLSGGQTSSRGEHVTMGQLTGSMAHDVAQPITVTAASAQAALRWIAQHPPDLEQVRQLLARIVTHSTRAGEVVQRIRDLIKKAPLRQDLLEINAPVRDVIELTRREAISNSVAIEAETYRFHAALPALRLLARPS
jgi:signal transduction histidine kinase